MSCVRCPLVPPADLRTAALPYEFDAARRHDGCSKHWTAAGEEAARLFRMRLALTLTFLAQGGKYPTRSDLGEVPEYEDYKFVRFHGARPTESNG